MGNTMILKLLQKKILSSKNQYKAHRIGIYKEKYLSSMTVI